MYSLLKIFKHKYIQIILVLLLFFVISRTYYNAFGGIAYPLIIFLLFIDDLTSESLIPISLLIGLFNDYLLNTYLGIGTLLFIGLGIMKLYGETRVDFKDNITKMIYGGISIIIYNIYYTSILGLKLFSSIEFLIIRILVDMIAFTVLFFLVRLSVAVFSFKR